MNTKLNVKMPSVSAPSWKNVKSGDYVMVETGETKVLCRVLVLPSFGNHPYYLFPVSANFLDCWTQRSLDTLPKLLSIVNEVTITCK